MKRRCLALILAAALLALCLAASAGASGNALVFFSINDQIPPELINSRVIYGGRAYVPYTLFSGYGLGINYTFFTSAETAYFYLGDQHIFFDMRSGDSYDAEDFHYPISAIYWGGTVYVPLSLMCSYFNLKLTTITGSEYGDILRVVNGAEYLTDEEFQQAAQSFMRTYYERYNAERPTPEPTPEPTPGPTPTPEPDHAGELLRLAFTGLPQTTLLDALARHGLRSVFYLTPEELRSDPALARRLCGEGHSVGIRCGADPEADWTEGRALLFDAARSVALLVCAGESPEEETEAALEALCRTHGAVRYRPDYVLEAEEAGAYPVFLITGWLGDAETLSPSLLLPASAMGGAALEQVLRYVEEQKYTLSRPREIDTHLTEGEERT